MFRESGERILECGGKRYPARRRFGAGVLARLW